MMRAEKRVALFVCVGARIFALPIDLVAESMRPLPRVSVGGPATYVRGVAVIRGRPTPVVDLGALVGGDAAAAPRRMVTLRGPRPLALIVDDVLGVRALPDEVEALPALLAGAEHDVVAALGRVEERLLLLLRGSLEVPAALHASLGLGSDAEAAS